jgi:hypothetical protein
MPRWLKLILIVLGILAVFAGVELLASLWAPFGLSTAP